MARNSHLKTPRTTSALSLDEAKNHLRIPTGITEEDDYLQALIDTATDVADKYCNISIMQQTYVQYADKWEDTIQLFHSPIEGSGAVDMVQVEYIATGDGTTYSTWAITNYKFDKYSCPTRLVHENGKDYPSIEDIINAIKIEYKVGYGTASDVPKGIKQALLIMVGQWYENRQEAIVGRSVGTIPMTATYILDKYRIRTFGIPN